ncbi:MAG: carboxypeptidase regulatory-like domain-containing protein [Caldilineaceae bacterium]
MKLATVWYRTAFVLLVVGLIGIAVAWQISGWSTAMAFEGVSQQVPTDGNGAIRGKVTDDAGAPILGIKVMLSVRPSNITISTTLTDASGDYSFDNLALGDYTICTLFTMDPATSQYFHECYDNIPIGQPGTVISVSDLVPVHEHIDISLSTGAHISGHITGESGQPIEGIEVRIYFALPGGDGQVRWEPFNSTKSDANGDYTLKRIIAGIYRICALNGRGYFGECYNDAANVDSAQDIVIATNQYLNGYDFHLPVGGSILGSVTYNDGQMVPWGRITAYLSIQGSDGSPIWEQFGEPFYVQGDGYYTITGLATGTYRLQLENPYPDELPFIGEYYKDATSVETATDIPVVMRQTVPNINFQVGRHSLVYGKVTDMAGQPIQNIVVAAEPLTSDANASSDQTAYSFTGPTGEYNYVIATPGTYRFKFYEVAFQGNPQGYITEYYNDSLTPEGATPVVVGPEAMIAHIDAQLGAQGIISGTVVDSRGNPLQGMSVALYVNNLLSIRGASTDQSGGFEFRALQAGNYRVCASYTTSFLDVPRCYGNADNVDSATEIAVANNLVFKIVITLPDRGAIGGSVTSAYGLPIESALVDLYVWRNNGGSGFDRMGSFQTDKAGNFGFTGLMPSSPNYHYYVGAATVMSNSVEYYLGEFYDNKPVLGSATPITVESAHTSTINLQLDFSPNINAPPYARNDAIWVSQVATSTRFTSGILSILTNDQDFENAPLTVSVTVSPTHGTLQLAASGTFTYTHDSSNTVFDSFTYHVNDGNSDSNSATVSIILPDAQNLFLPLVER